MSEDESIYTGEAKRAFIVRISGSEEKMLQLNEIMIGWSKAEGLIDKAKTKAQMRDIIQKIYFPMEKSKRRAGQVAGDLWRFIMEMKIGHYVIVATSTGFYIGKVAGPAYYDEMKIFNDTAYRRKVEWLNNKKPVPFEKMTPELQKKLKIIQSVIDATPYYQEIEFSMRIA